MTATVIEHGEVAYRRRLCKCQVCRAANATRFRQDQADRCARLAADPTIRQHGLSTTYEHWGCRCTPCADAARPARHATPVKRGPGEVERARRQREERRKRLLYAKPTGKGMAEPFGREWLDEAV